MINHLQEAEWLKQLLPFFRAEITSYNRMEVNIMELWIITIILAAVLFQLWICITFMVFDIKNGRKISNLIEYFVRKSEEKRKLRNRRR